MYVSPSKRASAAVQDRIERVRQLHGEKAATWFATQVLIAIDTILSEAVETQIERCEIDALPTMRRRRLTA